MLVAIINNNQEHQIPLSNISFDYLYNRFIFTNVTEFDWSNSLIQYLISLNEVTINSIIIKNNDEIIRTYSNLNHHILNFNEQIQYQGEELIITTHNFEVVPNE